MVSKKDKTPKKKKKRRRLYGMRNYNGYWKMSKEGEDMASRKKVSQEEGGGNWMDTYGDMVTLLLTFFVMLYASSSIDKEKWQQIYQSFVSNGKFINSVVDSEHSSKNSEGELLEDLPDGEFPHNFNQLYQYLTEYVKNENLQDNVEIEKGKSHIFLKFRNNIFFAGDSSVILDEGKDVLKKLGLGIKSVSNDIKIIKVGGHTAKVKSSTADDTALSSDRAVNVVNYLRDHNYMAPNKLISSGYGPYRPVAPNDTEENRAKNRRVEMVIIQNNLDLSDPDIAEELLELEYGPDDLVVKD